MRRSPWTTIGRRPQGTLRGPLGIGPGAGSRPAALEPLYRHRRPVTAADPARSPTARDERLARVEAVLFLAREPISSRKLAQMGDLADGTEARTLLSRLNACHDREGRAFRVEEVAGGFQHMTRTRFGPWLRRRHQAPVDSRISAPARETLAVVAYRQPAPRVEILVSRGVQWGEVLRQLMDSVVVRIAGRSQELG